MNKVQTYERRSLTFRKWHWDITLRGTHLSMGRHLLQELRCSLQKAIDTTEQQEEPTD